MASSLKSSKSEEKRDEELSKDKSDQVETDGEEEESPETSEKSSEGEEVEKLDSEDAAVVSEKILHDSVKEREKGTEESAIFINRKGMPLKCTAPRNVIV